MTLLIAFLLAAPSAAESYDVAQPKAAAANAFLITWIGSPSVRIEDTFTAFAEPFSTYQDGDVIISGPWIDGKRVNYDVLHNPTDDQVKSALKRAREALDAAKLLQSRSVRTVQDCPT